MFLGQDQEDQDKLQATEQSLPDLFKDDARIIHVRVPPGNQILTNEQDHIGNDSAKQDALFTNQ